MARKKTFSEPGEVLDGVDPKIIKKEFGNRKIGTWHGRKLAACSQKKYNDNFDKIFKQGIYAEGEQGEYKE